MPLPNPPEPTTIYAKWMGRLPLPTKEPPPPDPMDLQVAGQPTQKSIDRYHVLIPPHSPLAVGQEIKIKALSRVAFHAPQGTTPLIKYDTYNPLLWGRLISIWATTLDMVEYVLFNEAPNRAVIFAYVAIQKIPGYTTVAGGKMERHGWCRDQQLFLPFIPLETATIALLDNLARPNETENDKGREPARSYLAHTVRTPRRPLGPRKTRRAGVDRTGSIWWNR